MITELTITRPDDWHLHLRDHELMSNVVQDSAAVFSRALIMPNLNDPVITTKKASAYRDRILDALPQASDFQPLMTLFLTPETTVQEIHQAWESGFIMAVKLYPAGATTHSTAGVRNIDQCRPIFEVMQKIGMPLSLHGEVADEDVDIFDREKVFIDSALTKLLDRFPGLRIIFEHLTTRQAVDFVKEASPNLAATITAHHLVLNRNNLLVGGISPHYYCLPVVKRESDRQALLRAATSGNPKFFLGTDSAPHFQSSKESACGAAGIFSAPLALPLYAEAFESMGRLDKLEGFTSFFGADFYRLERNTQTITLLRREWKVAENIKVGDQYLVPLKAGQNITWQIQTP